MKRILTQIILQLSVGLSISLIFKSLGFNGYYAGYWVGIFMTLPALFFTKSLLTDDVTKEMDWEKYKFEEAHQARSEYFSFLKDIEQRQIPEWYKKQLYVNYMAHNTYIDPRITKLLK